jgi:hypothetical protein
LGSGFSALGRVGGFRAAGCNVVRADQEGAARTRSLQAGFQLHLSKPIQPTELAAAVLALVGLPVDRPISCSPRAP